MKVRSQNRPIRELLTLVLGWFCCCVIFECSHLLLVWPVCVYVWEGGGAVLRPLPTNSARPYVYIYHDFLFFPFLTMLTFLHSLAPLLDMLLWYSVQTTSVLPVSFRQVRVQKKKYLCFLIKTMTVWSCFFFLQFLAMLTFCILSLSSATLVTQGSSGSVCCSSFLFKGRRS